MDPNIADFIRAHRRKYTREAITQQLLEAGHDRKGIDATWAALDAPDPDETAGEAFWGRFFVILIGINLAVLLLVGLATGSLFSPERFGLLGVLAVVLAIGALISWGLVAATGPAKMGRATATVIGTVIPLVLALLLGGTCYTLLGSLGPPPRTGSFELQVEAGGISGTGTATCHADQPGGGFSVFGELGSRPHVTVAIDTFPPNGRPISDEIRNVMVSIEPVSEAEPGGTYSSYTGAAQLASEVSRGGLAGSVTFSNLAADLDGELEGSPLDPISGSASWNCE